MVRSDAAGSCPAAAGRWAGRRLEAGIGLLRGGLKSDTIGLPLPRHAPGVSASWALASKADASAIAGWPPACNLSTSA